MLSFVLRRAGRLLLTVLLISTLVFFLIRILPGDPAEVVAGFEASDAELAEIRERLGTDEPVLTQYIGWLTDLLKLDLGRSFFSNEPVRGLIFARLPVTLLLAGLAFLFALAVAVPLGVISAVRRGTFIDYVGVVYSQLGMAIPGFWLGILLLLVFSVKLGIMPLFGADSLVHFVLPALALGVSRSAVLVRIVRNSAIQELDREYVLTAESKGLAESTIHYRHLLRNALLPVITIAGIQLGYLLGGTIIIEQVFSLPGLGRLFLSGIYDRDFPVIQASVVFLAVVFSLVNFTADVLYSMANPRIRVG
ncbi:MAG: ABC transporter permease subunit [Spirochaetes bacterium]|jgi:peptide/nickel transport system permease protein|nr:ABC transporter permease subunit [Spirochaetota bacterium]